jgi:hypothetical protein
VPWPWDSIDPNVVNDEGSLPDALDGDAAGWWDEPNDWRSSLLVDDRPAWDREPEPRLRICRRCGELADLDPLRHCLPCRSELNRCQWRGLDPIRYKRLEACATCYRWLRRNLAEVGFAFANEQLMVNAEARYQRRSGRS